MSIMQGFISELDMEAPATRAMLERVPEDRLGWRPHERSMSLGQLALHVAQVPGAISEFLTVDEIAAPDFDDRPSPASRDEILEALDESLETAKRTMEGIDDEAAHAVFRVTRGGEELMSLPKVAVARAILLNHWYHHRGQLSVYLRLLDVPVPATYGASADESAFA